MESTKETGCQAAEGPILCINNCGFFGSAATMNMCSKCHKDMVLKQQQAKLAAESIENMVNGGGSSSSSSSSSIIKQKDPLPLADAVPVPVELKVDSPVRTAATSATEARLKEGTNRCSSCRKRVGLTGFSCRCGSLFCSVHRYSDKHECPFDYRSAGQEAIAKANPLVKADKLDKI